MGDRAVTNPATNVTYRETALDPLKKGHMPKFEGEPSADDIAIVSRWTRAHAHASASWHRSNQPIALPAWLTCGHMELECKLPWCDRSCNQSWR